MPTATSALLLVSAIAKKEINWAFTVKRKGRFADLLNTIEWYWHVQLYSLACKILAFVAAFVSIIILWCEFSISLYTAADLSILSGISKLYKSNDSFFELLLFGFLAYMSACSYRSLLKIRLFDYVKLIPHHQTDSNSLLFSASYLCRLAPTLAYNFLNLMHLESSSKAADGNENAGSAANDGNDNQAQQLTPSDNFDYLQEINDSSGETTTAFAAVLGDMNVFALGSAFNIYFPLFILIIAIATLTNCYARILSSLNINVFRFDEDFEHDHLENGRAIATLEKNRLLRSYHAASDLSSNSASDTFDVPISLKNKPLNKSKFPSHNANRSGDGLIGGNDSDNSSGDDSNEANVSNFSTSAVSAASRITSVGGSLSGGARIAAAAAAADDDDKVRRREERLERLRAQHSRGGGSVDRQSLLSNAADDLT